MPRRLTGRQDGRPFKDKLGAQKGILAATLDELEALDDQRRVTSNKMSEAMLEQHNTGTLRRRRGMATLEGNCHHDDGCAQHGRNSSGTCKAAGLPK